MGRKRTTPKINRCKYMGEEYDLVSKSNLRKYDLNILESLFGTMLKAINEFEKPFLTRFDLCYHKKYEPKKNSDISSFVTRVRDKFKKNPPYRDSKQKGKKLRFRRRYKQHSPLIFWVKEYSKSTMKYDELTNSQAGHFHYHCFIITDGVTHASIIQNLLQKIWKAVLENRGASGYLYRCKEKSTHQLDLNDSGFEPTCYYSLYENGETVSATSKSFRDAFARISYLAKADTKPIRSRNWQAPNNVRNYMKNNRIEEVLPTKIKNPIPATYDKENISLLV